MIHRPLENLIFNSYKKLKNESIGDGKKLMEKIGDGGYRKLVMDLMRQGKTSDPGSDLVLQTAQTLKDVVNLTFAARKAFGEARLATATKAAEFMRVIFGSETTEVAAGGGYYCQKCMIQPKYDYHWTKAKGVGKLSGWFCGAQGCPYDTSRMAGLITFTDKTNPEKSFVMNTRMAKGTIANMLSTIKVVNAIRMGECRLTPADVERASGIGCALKNMIGCDNDRYYRLFDKLRAVEKPAKLTYPDIAHLHLPDFKICETVNDVTLTSSDFDRGCIVYDVAKLFDMTEEATPSCEAWKAVVQTVLGAWGLAEAVAIHPDKLNGLTSCSKKTLNRLREWTYIRAIGRLPPNGDKSGRPATEDEKRWASNPFKDF